MKPQFCEHESAVVAALQRGMLPDELLRHTDNCPVCSEVLLVAEGLRTQAAFEQEERPVPDAAIIWRKAQARARDRALSRATLPIRIMGTGAFALAILVSPWLVLQFSHSPAGMPSWLPHLPSLETDANWLATLTGTALFGIVATFVCLGLSSWYMLREE